MIVQPVASVDSREPMRRGESSDRVWGRCEWSPPTVRLPRLAATPGDELADAAWSPTPVEVGRLAAKQSVDVLPRLHRGPGVG